MSLKEDTIRFLKSIETEILDKSTYSISDKIKDYLEEQGYQLYDDAAVINVKGRPNVEIKYIQFLRDLYPIENDIANRIQDFAQELSEMFEDFVIKGRMAGYWGLDNASEHVEISNFDELADFYINKMNNDKEAQEDPDFTNNPEDYYYQFVGGENAIDVMGELIKVKLDDNFMDNLEEIKLAIDTEEKSMNKALSDLASMDIFGHGYDESKKNEDNTKEWYELYLSTDTEDSNSYYEEYTTFKDAVDTAKNAIRKFDYPEIHLYKMSDKLKRPQYIKTFKAEEITESRKDYFDDALSGDSKFRYMLLDRMIQDCKYFIEHPNNKYLWAKTPEDQIQLMKELYNSFEEKPEWTSLEEIEELAKSMGVEEI